MLAACPTVLSSVPFESKDGSLHSASQATVQLDLQLSVVEVEVESKLGLVGVSVI